MKCSYCNKEISSASAVDELAFCNNLCKYLWEKEKESRQPKTSGIKKGEEKKIFLDNLDFILDLDGFENRNLLIRGSYWHGSVLYLDGKKVKPIEKKWLKRERRYSVINNYGNPVEIILKLRPFDAIPGIIVNGQKFDIYKALRWYEYVWMGIPLILMYGGAIGALIGGGTLIANSVIFRKTANKFLKYFFSGLNTIFAFLLFFQLIGMISPYVKTLIAKTASTAAVDKILMNQANEINKNAPFMVDNQTRLDNAMAAPGKHFIYYYTLVNITSGEIDTVSAKEIMKPNMINMLKTDPVMQQFKDYEVTLLYNYRDKDGKYIMQVRVEPEEYE